ncbi:hypothetical protein SLNWT_7132 [Streptomyces albus]|uniref:Uncharacterized protein n=1 Tax=Streptomyces albus (strain ATCC 21838 / DSM 41398 / FERM P-419 / JCM 4703 / NBRC 107858) TaxID=1081613 RepID=A0A0B5EXG3_STRA4|nr:hypothetical protein SLNWT_7132 [Streptomyces albus]AOU81812.1 hypothetical protein SLNHY_7121 [Streptomyces albus]AYN37500.1 hypothetical protein DUI70_7007 [Streptomyces albus]
MLDHRNLMPQRMVIGPDFGQSDTTPVGMQRSRCIDVRETERADTGVR